ncbi:alpha/beta fold hydrolase [Nocardioides baekrokdamisoli]|uniref:alpha/beta fold hydrolase n=1 Tax=Nocardioides baekrokdamisoli TaxID=1804624 RepID=UPI0013DD88C7|nr:alpha/beta hydrolase [Nocardioides baekrokdamisoli]
MSTSTSRARSRAGFDTLTTPDGTVLAVVDAGPRDSAATIVLQHGWTQDHTSWEDVAERLAGTYRVVSFDSRGHGRSDAGPRGTATVEQLADDLAEVIDQLAPEGPLVLAGHSLGGPVLLALAERRPDIVFERATGIAMVATSAANIGRDILGLPLAVTSVASAAVPAVSRLRQFSRAPRNTRYPRVIEEFVRLGLYGPGQGTRANRSRTARQVARSHPETTAALVPALMHHDRLAMMPLLDKVPTVILGGTKDALTPIAHSRAMAEALPQAKYVVYPQAGHMLPYERANEVTGELTALAERVTILSRTGV